MPLLGVAACGGEADSGDATSGDPGALPAPNVTAFTGGTFDDIPRHPLGDPINERDNQDGVTVQSFLVRDTAPRDVIDYYQDVLAEQEMVGSIEETGENAYRGEWMLDGRILQVSTRLAPTGDQAQDRSSDAQTQYSLILFEEGETPPEFGEE